MVRMVWMVRMVAVTVSTTSPKKELSTMALFRQQFSINGTVRLRQRQAIFKLIFKLIFKAGDGLWVQGCVGERKLTGGAER